MEGLVVWTCLAILLQFHGVLCEQRQVNRESSNDERIRRNHESDLQKLKVKHGQIKSTKTLAPIVQTTKTLPKPVIKQKLPINERNEPKDVSVINNILEEIAHVAHNHNESKGINKIRHLVDEIDKQNKVQDSEAKLAKPNPINTNNLVKTPKKEEMEIEKAVPKHALANETISKEVPEKLPHKCDKVLEIVSSKDSVYPLKTENIIAANEPVVTSERRISELGEKTSSKNESFKKQCVKNDNLIEIKEHVYEEESFHTNPCKYTQRDTYKNWYMGQKYNPRSYTDNNNYISGNNIANYYEDCVTYPTNTYGEYDNGNYYVNFDANPGSVTPVPCQRNEDYSRSRKIWLDRDSIIQVKDPNEYQVKTINEDRKEITSVQRPNFYRNYYSVVQKQYSSDGISKSQNVYYYTDPYHCS